MTRKDYELIARAIDRAKAATVAQTRHDHRERTEKIDALDLAATSLEVALGQENPRFAASRFCVAATQGPLYLAALNDENLARELGPRESDESDIGESIDCLRQGVPGRLSPRDARQIAEHLDTLDSKVFSLTQILPSGYKILADGIMDPYYAIKDDEFGTIVGGTHATRQAAIADAQRHATKG